MTNSDILFIDIAMKSERCVDIKEAWERIRAEIFESTKPSHNNWCVGVRDAGIKEAGRTGRARRPAQQRKGESEPFCIRCGHSKPCLFLRRGPSCRKWWAAHLSPVA